MFDGKILIKRFLWKCAVGTFLFFPVGFLVSVPFVCSSVYAQGQTGTEPTTLEYRTYSIIKDDPKYDDGVYVTVTTFTIYEDGSVEETVADPVRCTETNSLGCVVDDQGKPAIVDGTLRYPNGNPYLNSEGQVLDEEGNLKYPEVTEEIIGDGFRFKSARVKPDWSDPMYPTPDGSTQSGYITLNGEIEKNGYNGSDLRYYFNDESDKNRNTRNDLIGAVTVGTAGVVAAVGASVTAATGTPFTYAALAVAIAQEGIAIGSLSVYAAQLAHFDKWSENYVGAIDFNSSYTVTGGGTLAGTYQNIETMLLEKGDYTVTGQILVVDRLHATDSLTVDTTGRIAVVNSIQIDKDLTNKGIITEINQLTVSGKLTNFGEMSKINVLSAKDVENSGTITVGDATVSNLVNTGNWAAKGEVNATSIGNSGSLHAGGSLIVSGAITNSNSFSALGTITADSISQTGKDSIWISKGTIDTKTLKIEGGSFTSSGAVSVEKALTNSGVTVFGNSLKAGSIQNDTGGTIFTLGTTKIDGTMLNNGTWIAGASIQTEAATNSGTFSVLGDWNAASIINTGDIGITGNLTSKENIQNRDDSLILGTSAAASMQGTALNNHGTIRNFRNILFTGSSGSANEGMISGLGANSSLTLYGNLRNEGTIQEFSSLSTVNMTNTGTISGTGLNSVIQLSGTLTNSGILAAWEKFSVNEKTVNHGTISGVGEGSVYRFGDGLENHGTVSEVEKLSVTGDLTNKKTISGTGKDSSLKSSGKLTNAEGASIQNYESLTVDGELSNSGTLIATGDGSVYEAGSLVNAGTIGNLEKLAVKGDLTNTKTIEGTGKDSSLKSSGKLTNAEGAFIQNYESLTVDGELSNSGTLIATGDGSVYEAGSLVNAGTIGNLEKLAVKGDLTNTKTIEGTGKDSSLKSSGKLTNAEGAFIQNYESLTVDGELSNSGTLTATGQGSVYEAGTLVNAGTIGNLEKLAVKGTSNISGEVTGTGTGASFRTDGLYGAEGTGAFTGKITGFSEVSNSQTLVNQGTITGTGAGSTLTQNGDLKNESEISGFQNARFTGTVENVAAGILSGTGSGSVWNMDSSLKNEGSIAQIETLNVSGNAENDGTMNVVAKLSVTGDLTNTKTITGTGKDSLLKVSRNLTNAEGAFIQNYESLTVDEKLSNSGTLTATGQGSVYEAGSLVNPGKIENLEKLTVKGTSNISGEVTGTGTGASFRTDGLYGAEGTGAFTGKITGFSEVSNSQTLVNQGTITGTGAGSTLTQNGDLKNELEISGFQNANISGDAENIGTITGTGFGSQYIFGGNLTNQQGGSISEIDSLIIEKDFENYGTLKIFGNMQVHGGFTNGSSELNEDGSTTYTGGDIYIVYQNGVFGETSVTGGDAVINGGNLYLSGDRLTVGQNYLFLTVHGEGNELIVNQPFEILPDSEMIPKLFHAEGFYNDTEYWVSLRRDFEYGPAGSTPNQISTGTYLDKIAYTLNTQEDYENNDLFRVLSALDDISANSESGTASDEVHLALDRMSGTIFANMNLMTLQNGWQVHQNLANIIRPMDCPFNECDHPEQRFSNAWGSFLGNTGQVDSDGNSYGFNYDSAGLIVGYDFFRSRGFRSGAYFQYVNANMNERETMADAEIDNYDLGLYALLRNEWGYLAASGNFGYSNYDTTRRVAFGGPNDWIDRTHYGRTYSTQQSLRVESAGEFAFWENRFLLRPFAGLTYVRMQMDDLEEHSRDENDYVTELSSRFDDLNSLRSELGARLSFCWKNDRRCLGMNLRASWVHEFCDTQVMIENKFTHPTQNPPDYMFSDTTSSFLITGTDLGEDYAWIGFGLTLDTGSFWTLFGGYDGLLNGSTTLHTGNLGISFSW